MKDKFKDTWFDEGYWEYGIDKKFDWICLLIGAVSILGIFLGIIIPLEILGVLK